MALIRLPAENTTLTEFEAVRSFLATHGIDYEKWTPEHPVGADATSETILGAYRPGDRNAEGSRWLSHR